MRDKSTIPVIVGVVILAVLAVTAAGLSGFSLLDTQEDPAGTGDVIEGETATGEPGTGFRAITDLAGRTVVIPVNVTKVLCTSPPPSTYVYMLAPEKLAGWQLSLSEEGMKFISEENRDIPTVGWGSSMSYEDYIARDPDLVFVMYTVGSDISSVENVQQKLGSIPVVAMPDARNATEYDTGLRFVGDVLGVPDVADREIAYYLDVLSEVEETVALIPEEERVRVYYAEGSNGLYTDPSGSCHSQLIDICGGVNVADCAINSGSGQTEVTKESVLKWSPEVIITTSDEFYEFVFTDESWQEIPAVKTGRVYPAPHYPYNWFDRPPGVNRIVGIPWTAHVLYPDYFPEEWFESRVKEYYSIFYHYELSDEDLEELLSGGV